MSIVNSSPPNRATVSASRYGLYQPLADGHQKPVARDVAEAVVHVLEVIDIQEKHRERLATFAAGPAQRVRHAIEKQRAIGQTGQRIVEGVVNELALRLTLFRDVAADARHSQDAVLRTSQDRVVPQDDAA